MYETSEQVAAMQALIDESMRSASKQLQGIARPDRRLSAEQVIEVLRGKRQMAVATTSARGEPRVSPLDVLLLRAEFFFCTSQTAAKVKHLRNNPAVSLAYIDSDVVGITVHGRAVLHEWGDPAFGDLDQEFLTVYGGTPSTEAEGVVFIEVIPERLYTFDRRAEVAAQT